jgi:hypothetical protein
VAEIDAFPDDGIGRRYTLTVSPSTLASGGTHVLRFEVPRGPTANGLCIYGPAGRTPLPGLTGSPLLLRAIH